MIDDGLSVVCGAARIAMDYEHQGLYMLFDQYLDSNIRTLMPSIQRLIFTSGYSEVWQERIKAKPDVYELLFTRVIQTHTLHTYTIMIVT